MLLVLCQGLIVLVVLDDLLDGLLGGRLVAEGLALVARVSSAVVAGSGVLAPDGATMNEFIA